MIGCCLNSDRFILLRNPQLKDEFYGSIEKTAQQLKSKGFFMPHRSYLVNYRFVKCFQLKKIIMTNGCEIPISDNRREEVLKIQVVMENGGSAKKSL